MMIPGNLIEQKLYSMMECIMQRDNVTECFHRPAITTTIGNTELYMCCQYYTVSEKNCYTKQTDPQLASYAGLEEARPGIRG